MIETIGETTRTKHTDKRVHWEQEVRLMCQTMSDGIQSFILTLPKHTHTPRCAILTDPQAGAGINTSVQLVSWNWTQVYVRVQTDRQ